MKSLRATKINPACGQRPSGEVLFRSRPRSRRSSNEVAPSAGGGGGARDRRSRFSSSSPVRRGGDGGRRREISAEFRGGKHLLSKLRFAELPAPSVPLGTRRLELALQSTAGGGPQEGLAKFGQFRWGLAKGVGIPLAAIFAYFLSHHRK